MPVGKDLSTFNAALVRALNERRARRRLKGRADRGRHPKNTYTAAIFYGLPDPQCYQVEQWLEPLKQAMGDHHKLVIITRKPSAAEVFVDDGTFPVFLATQISDLEQFLAQQDIQVTFYVNNSQTNFLMLPAADCTHVALGHGESDKAASATNQFRAYNYVFVSGEAGVARLANRLLDYNWQHQVVIAGRPQIDREYPKFPLPDDDKITVLYAPTWDGDKVSVRYTSLDSHGEQVVDAFIKTGRHRVIFRPHPLAGTMRPEVMAAKERVISKLEAANRADPTAGHVIDTETSFGWHLKQIDACVSDISAVAFDWLATAKPLVVTMPSEPRTIPDPKGIAGSLDLLPADRAPEVAAIVDELISDGVTESYKALVDYYFGDTTPGASTERFVGAVREMFVRNREAREARDRQSFGAPPGRAHTGVDAHSQLEA